jgi:hypothetical protein
MNRQILSRTIAALILALLFAWFAHRAGVRWNQDGQEAFMQREVGRYERYFATPGGVVLYTIELPLLWGAFVLVYESLAYGISKLIFTPGGGKSVDGRL